MKPQPYVVENTHEAGRKLAERLAHPLQIGAGRRSSGNFPQNASGINVATAVFPCRNGNIRSRMLIQRDLKAMVAFRWLMKPVVQEVAEKLRAARFSE
jgi:hypothetical protein